MAIPFGSQASGVLSEPECELRRRGPEVVRFPNEIERIRSRIVRIDSATKMYTWPASAGGISIKYKSRGSAHGAALWRTRALLVSFSTRKKECPIGGFAFFVWREKKMRRGVETGFFLVLFPSDQSGLAFCVFFFLCFLSCACRICEDAFFTLSRVSSSSPLNTSSVSLSAASSHSSSSRSGSSMRWL